MKARSAHPITPAGQHFTAGYYDRCPWSPDGAHMLVQHIPHNDHLPLANESAAMCVIDCASGELQTLAETAAWNHQQASMQHWLPYEPGHCIFNDRDGERVFSRVIDRTGRKIRELPRPVYCLSKDGRLAVSLNFARIPRRGYSYAVSDPFREGGQRCPLDEALWLMDTKTGACRQLTTYKELLHSHPDPDNLSLDPYIWLNHAIFNCNDSRIMVLLRYDLNGQRQTYLYTMDLDGGSLRCALPASIWRAGGVTHQMWGRTPDELLIDAHFRRLGDGELTVFNDRDSQPVFHSIGQGFLGHGHQVFSPDGRHVVSDTYPRGAGEQHLTLIDLETDCCHALGTYRHPLLTKDLAFPHDCRCDLHPRWSRDGRCIAIDSFDDGTRRVAVVDVADCVGGQSS